MKTAFFVRETSATGVILHAQTRRFWQPLGLGGTRLDPENGGRPGPDPFELVGDALFWAHTRYDQEAAWLEGGSVTVDLMTATQQNNGAWALARMETLVVAGKKVGSLAVLGNLIASAPQVRALQREATSQQVELKQLREVRAENQILREAAARFRSTPPPMQVDTNIELAMAKKELALLRSCTRSACEHLLRITSEKK